MTSILQYYYHHNRGTYLRDFWNLIDFVVTVAGFFTLNSGSSVSFFRLLRLLRPLRSVNHSINIIFYYYILIVPRMKMLLSTLVYSLPGLLNVVILLFCVFVLFGIVGIQLMMGFSHNHCRLTPYPIQIDNSTVLSHYLEYKYEYYQLKQPKDHIFNDILYNRNLYPYCYDNELNDTEIGRIIPLENNKWDKNTSPWNKPRNCVWPEDTTIMRLCSIHNTTKAICPYPEVCGSNYDNYGNKRFTDEMIMKDADYYLTFGYNYVSFDNLWDAFIIIVNTLTLEGWSDIMYMFMDSYSVWFIPIWFVLIILLGNYFLSNFILAIIYLKHSEVLVYLYILYYY